MVQLKAKDCTCRVINIPESSFSIRFAELFPLIRCENCVNLDKKICKVCNDMVFFHPLNGCNNFQYVDSYEGEELTGSEPAYKKFNVIPFNSCFNLDINNIEPFETIVDIIEDPPEYVNDDPPKLTIWKRVCNFFKRTKKPIKKTSSPKITIWARFCNFFKKK